MNRTRIFLAAALLAPLTALVAGAPPAAAEEVRDICFPMEGGARIPGSFGAPRGGGTRSHEGEDLMAPKGTRLLSAVDGTVREIVHANDKGNRVVVQDDEGWFYVYIHVNNDTPGTDDGQATFEQAFAAGLTEGQRVSRCQHIAYNGDSGNAENTAPHLHFEIRRPPADGSTSRWAWSRSPAIDPAPSLRIAAGQASGAGAPHAAPASSSTRWTPFASAAALVERQYLDFYGRRPDADGARYWAGRLNAGSENASTFITKLLTAPEFEARIAPVARLYWAYFGRIPDTGGLLHWIGETTNGTRLGDISQAFAGSPEFIAAYGTLSNRAFVDLVYRNVLSRTADGDGLAHWLRVLDGGRASRGDVMVGFSESPEYRSMLAARVQVVLAYVAMLNRSPDAGGLDHWAARGTGELVPGIYASPEYAARIRGL